MKKALIGSIGRYSLHDGPGIRTTVFFKGCNMRCPWCHNPEFISDKPEIAFYTFRCIQCKECLSVCPENAIDFENPGRILRNVCTGCGLCVQACPSRALELVGENMSLEELMEILLRDNHFYWVSGGGVTISGGEPTVQMDFLEKLLKALKKMGIRTAIETNGLFSWNEFSQGPLKHLDLVLFDLKIADHENHRYITGVNNQTILANLKLLLEMRWQDVIVRIPLIPGYTATAKNISDLSEIMVNLGARRINLLPYHPFGNSKAEKVGRRTDSSLPATSMKRSELIKWQGFFLKTGHWTISGSNIELLI